MYRTRARQREYDKRVPNDSSCALCDLSANTVISDEGVMMVMDNKYPYSHFEARKMREHLMIVAKRHVASIGDMSDDERLCLIKLQQRFESRGYSLFLRGSGSPTKSIPSHFHMHLIKTEKSPFSFFLYIAKPNILFFKSQK